MKREAIVETTAHQEAKRQQPPLQKAVKVKSEEGGVEHTMRNGDVQSPKSPISVRKDLMSQNSVQEKERQNRRDIHPFKEFMI